ncbi:MAG: cytochrome P450 [Bacteroidetes bacterium]|nr:MAG: cytochrome P450 [Bacteroidota bacterium]
MGKQIHELSGPKGLPVFGNIFRLDLPKIHQQIENWADEYGDVYCLDLFKISQLVVTRPSLIQAIANERPHLFKRSGKLDQVIREGGVHGVFNAEGDDWYRYRSVVTKGLDVKHQQAFYPDLVEKVSILYQKWKHDADSGEVTDIQKDLLRFTVDITTLLAFGYDIDTMRKEGGVIQDHLEVIFPTLFKRINSPISWHNYFKTNQDKRFDQAVQEMKKIVDVFISEAQERLQSNPSLKESPRNLLESILVAAEEEQRFSIDEIRGNLMTLLMAGEDTTAHTLTWLIFLLLDKPDAIEMIREEADRVIGEAPFSEVYSQNQQLKYAEAAASESLRFKPVAPILLYEALDDVELEGITISKGQRILTQYRHAALKDIYFSYGKEFIPDRWINRERCPVHDTKAYTPFGSGPRYCPGRNLAYLEIRAIISMLYKNFDVELIEDENVEEVMAFTMMASSLKVKLKNRNYGTDN